MSETTWTQYVAMDDASPEPGRFQAALESLEDWDDDFDLAGPDQPCGPDGLEDLE